MFPLENSANEVLEVLRRLSLYGERGSLEDELQQSPVIVVLERQTTDHLYNRRLNSTDEKL